jgi:hypothetical protein
MYSQKDYMQAINVSADWPKHNNPSHLEALMGLLMAQQWIPSRVSVQRAIKQLKLRRTDGGSAERDNEKAVLAAQQNLERVIAAVDREPISNDFEEYAASLNPRELSRIYYGEDGDAINEFAIRYRRLARERGYRIPDKFGAA